MGKNSGGMRKGWLKRGEWPEFHRRSYIERESSGGGGESRQVEGQKQGSRFKMERNKVQQKEKTKVKYKGSEKKPFYMKISFLAEDVQHAHHRPQKAFMEIADPARTHSYLGPIHDSFFFLRLLSFLSRSCRR